MLIACASRRTHLQLLPLPAPRCRRDGRPQRRRCMIESVKRGCAAANHAVGACWSRMCCCHSMRWQLACGCVAHLLLIHWSMGSSLGGLPLVGGEPCAECYKISRDKCMRRQLTVIPRAAATAATTRMQRQAIVSLHQPSRHDCCHLKAFNVSDVTCLGLPQRLQQRLIDDDSD